MNMPLVLLNRRRRGGSFSPYSLFSGTAIGIWLDPSDVANLSWRRNLLTYSEQFDNAAWASGYTGSITRTANTIAAPDGTITADTLTATGTGGRAIQQVVSATASATYTFSVWLKRKTGAGQVRIYANYDAFANRLITEDITDWVRVSYTYTGSALWPGVFVNTSGDEIYAWGAQLELGSVATDYQRISDVNTEVIERFPSATMYQDAAGTTAVTTPGQPVGLRLDKSKGLVLGPEILTNGNFFGGSTGWTAGTTPLNWTFAGGAINGVDASGGYQNVGQVISGKSYVAEFTISGWTTGSVSLENAGAGAFGAVFSGDGVKRQFFTAAATATIGFVRRTSNFTGSLDNFSVKELPGNHAVQSTAGSRPVYGIEPAGGRRNLLTWSEDFGNAIWLTGGLNSGIIANAIAAPDGTTTADVLRDDNLGGTGAVAMASAQTLNANAQYTFSIYAKAKQLSWLSLQAISFTSPANGGVWFDLENGAVGTQGAGYSGTILAVGGGWYRCSLTFTLSTDVVGQLRLYVCDADNDITVDRDGTSDLYLWGAQLETGSAATAYQRVTTAFDVTEAGVQSCHYVQYDGSDDGMVTNSIDFTATDKMSVFAGVRKSSDTNPYSMVLELSSASSLNNGAFALMAPYAGPNYGFDSKGTVATTAASASTFPAPINNLLTGLGDISGDRATLRVNGVQAAQSTGDQGTGNYGNYRLNLGRRGNDQATPTLPFSGRDYGIVVVGKATTADEITSTERWLSGKTGFYAPVITGVPTIGVS